MAFHSINGWYFERMEDGGVRITKTDQRPDHRGELILGVELPAGTWCSAVASVSARGETGETFAEAQALHGVDERPADDSDIEEGDEFDGPVVIR